MQPGDALRLMAACNMLFNSGRAVLTAAAAEARQQQASLSPSFLQSLRRAAYSQMTSVNSILLHAPAAVVPPFARTVGKPEVMLPWLSSVLGAFLLGTSNGADAAGGRARLLWQHMHPVQAAWTCSPGTLVVHASPACQPPPSLPARGTPCLMPCCGVCCACCACRAAESHHHASHHVSYQPPADPAAL